ncbi:hypothetical protein HRbin33_00612 [bacterium HR33]|nr:hypothetical protein HRbin33_00612 [bacterium HR33]
MTTSTRLAALTLLLMIAPNLSAQTSAGLRLSSLGVGPQLSVGASPRLEFKATLNYLSLSTEGTYSDIDYSVDLRWLSGELEGDVFLAGPVRLSGGLMLNGNRLSMSASPAGAVRIGDTTYAASDVASISASVDFRKVSPTLGLGITTRGRVGFVLDAGVVFQGSPKLSYTATTPLTGAAKARFDQEVQREADQVQSDIEWFKLYPVVGIGLRIRL